MEKTNLIDGKYATQALMVPIMQKCLYGSLQYTPTSSFGSWNTALEQLLMIGRSNKLSEKP